MLKSANVSIAQALKLFNSAGVTTGLLVPTVTGCQKSIMDATFSFRAFLQESGIHDYSTQKQGPDNKIFIPANFVLPDKCIKSQASLYRPCTKNGDPRIWFKQLTHYCKPTDLLSVVAHAGELFVFNMSNESVVQAFGIPGACPYEILANCSEVISTTATELLEKLRNIYQQGYIEGVYSGDTSVGMTLEKLLGIPPNSNRTPDYRGIELKASRQLGRAVKNIAKGKKITLFTNTPDWKRSPMSATDILNTFGYVGEQDRVQLYCTVSNEINRQGLFLDAHSEIDLINKADTEQYKGDVAIWALDTLKTRLAEKHRETFWVQASSEFRDGKEFFRYEHVRHTRKPNISNLASLFDAGIITLDYAMHFNKHGNVRDHGYLFRTTYNHLSHIFPLERVYDLSQH